MALFDLYGESLRAFLTLLNDATFLFLSIRVLVLMMLFFWLKLGFPS